MSSWDLLVLDLDGTLLGPGGNVSMANMDAIDHVRAQGVTLLVATGRCLNETRHLLEEIKYEGPMIGACGAVLSNCTDGRTLRRETLAPDLVHQVVSHLGEAGHTSLVLKDHHEAGYDYLLVGGSGLHPVSEWWMNSMNISCRWVDRIEDDPHPDDTIRVSGIDNPVRLDRAGGKIKEELGHCTKLLQWSAVTSSHATGSDVHILEVFAHGVDKWPMIEAFCNLHGLDSSRVIAIGDGLNDIGMLSRATLGIAMANANEHVRSAADELTGHHDEDGVATAIERIFGLEGTMGNPA